MNKGSAMLSALFVSGQGTTADYVLQKLKKKKFTRFEPVLIIASKNDAPAIERLKKYGIPGVVVEYSKNKSQSAFAQELMHYLAQYHISFGAMLGWLPLMPSEVIGSLSDGLINQHPGPLDSGRPDFGGKGMHGERVTCARISYSLAVATDYWTAATVHNVTANYDEGSIVREIKITYADIISSRTAIPVFQQNQDPSQLVTLTHEVHNRVRAIEAENVVAALADYETGKRSVPKRQKRLVSKNHELILHEAKELSIALDRGGKL